MYLFVLARGIHSTPPPPIFSEAFACKRVWPAKTPSLPPLADAHFFDQTIPSFPLNNSLAIMCTVRALLFSTLFFPMMFGLAHAEIHDPAGNLILPPPPFFR